MGVALALPVAVAAAVLVEERVLLRLGVAVPEPVADRVAAWLPVVEAVAPRDTVLGAVVEEEGEVVGVGLGLGLSVTLQVPEGVPVGVAVTLSEAVPDTVPDCELVGVPERLLVGEAVGLSDSATAVPVADGLVLGVGLRVADKEEEGEGLRQALRRP